MKKTEELKKLLADKENEDREILFMYPEESSDHPYTVGYAKDVFLDEYYIDDERVWLRDDNVDELREEMEDRMLFQHYRDKYATGEYASDEEIANIEKLAQKEIDSIAWEKCIVVYINP